MPPLGLPRVLTRRRARSASRTAAAAGAATTHTLSMLAGQNLPTAAPARGTITASPDLKSSSTVYSHSLEALSVPCSDITATLSSSDRPNLIMAESADIIISQSPCTLDMQSLPRDGPSMPMPAATVHADNVLTLTCDDSHTSQSHDIPVSQLPSIDVDTQPSGPSQPLGSTYLIMSQPRGIDTCLPHTDTLVSPVMAADRSSLSQPHDMTASCPCDLTYAHVTDTYLSTCVQQSYVIGTQPVHVSTQSHDATQPFAFHLSVPAPVCGDSQSSYAMTTYGHCPSTPALLPVSRRSTCLLYTSDAADE